MSSRQTIHWRNTLTLDASRKVVAGDVQALRRAIARGADLRVYSEFRHNEHIDTSSNNDDLIQETMDMRATYLVDECWCAGATTLRQPVALPSGFGPRPSLSLFLYNEDGSQAIARPFLDGVPAADNLGPSRSSDHSDMPKYHEQNRWDDQTNAPSSNFIYDFDTLRYFVRDDWQLALYHSSSGEVLAGSHDLLAQAFSQGVEWKISVKGLCADLAEPETDALPHEVFIQAGSCYLYTGERLMIAASHPLLRVRPAVPLRYASGNWDYAWLVARSDGRVSRLVYDPYTLQPTESSGKYEVKWFYR
ncbi:MAG: hypothetical protein H8E66_10135 [Planctomycetes bacterium]|nr:hypothetical protein [Planctomycetota bacterium]